MHSRLIKHGEKHRVEPYWVTSRVGIRGRDGSSVWLTWIGNMKAGILLANHGVAWFACREGAKQRERERERERERGGSEIEIERERERERWIQKGSLHLRLRCWKVGAPGCLMNSATR